MSTKITLKKNGTAALVDSKFEATREALVRVLTTQNIDSKGVQSAVKFLGANYPKTFVSVGKPEDLFEVYEDDKLIARGARKNISQRISDALNSAARAIEIITEKGEKGASVEQEVGAE